MRGAVFAVLSALITLANAQTRTATVQCYDGLTHYQMVFTVDKNNDPELNYVYAINSTDHRADTCHSYTTPNLFSNTSTSISITVNISKSSLTADAPCAHTNNGLEFQWRFLTTRFQNVIVKSLDVMFTVPCNFSDATPTYLTTYANITGSAAENLPTDTSLSFALQILDLGGSVVNTIALGDQIRLRINQVAGEQVVVTGHTCFASGDGVFDGNGEYELLSPNGCPKEYDTTKLITTGFNGTTGSATSGIIEQFQFVNTLDVYYQCTVHYCFTGNNECEDYCAGNTVGRKKREVQEDITASTSIRITMYPEPTYDTQIIDCPQATDAPQPISCLDNVGIIAAFSVLGGLLLATTAMAVCVFVRSSRLMASQHIREKAKL